jgi:Na+-driven multidrug efflux pump
MLRMKIMMAVYFTCGVMSVFPGLTRGMGYSMLPMLCSFVGACLLRIVWLLTFFAWNPTVNMLYACYPITWTIAGIGQVAIFFYARRRIRRRALSEEWPSEVPEAGLPENEPLAME